LIGIYKSMIHDEVASLHDYDKVEAANPIYKLRTAFVSAPNMILPLE